MAVPFLQRRTPKAIFFCKLGISNTREIILEIKKIYWKGLTVSHDHWCKCKPATSIKTRSVKNIASITIAPNSINSLLISLGRNFSSSEGFWNETQYILLCWLYRDWMETPSWTKRTKTEHLNCTKSSMRSETKLSPWHKNSHFQLQNHSFFPRTSELSLAPLITVEHWLTEEITRKDEYWC